MKKLLVYFAVLASAILMLGVNGAEVNNEEYFEWENYENGVQIIDYDESHPDHPQLEIPSKLDGDEVLKIDDGAFEQDFGESGLVEVAIPDTVQVIGDDAFAKNDLEKAMLSDNVKKIGESAFVWNNLHQLIVPDSVEIVKESAFSGNELKEVVLGNSITEIGWQAFWDNNLVQLDIPDSVKEIDGAAFSENKLEDVSFGDNLQKIGYGCFADNALPIVVLPDSVEQIEGAAFSNNEISQVDFGSGLNRISGWVFEDNELNDITISDNIDEIAVDAFNKNELVEVTIAQNVDVEWNWEGDSVDTMGDYTNEFEDAYKQNYSQQAGTYVYNPTDSVFELQDDEEYKVELSAEPAEAGTLEGAGTYDVDETVIVEAEANEGYKFINWTEDGTQVSSDKAYTFNIAQDRNLIANFEEKDDDDKRDLKTNRHYGDHRYETAVEISQASFPNDADVAVLARGDEFPDALAGVPLAYAQNGPLLLTPPDKLHNDTASEIDRLLAEGDVVYILGGEVAISEEVERELKNKDYEVERLAGVNRYDTATTIAEELPGDPSKAFLTTGTNFADAVAVSSIAALEMAPVILTYPDELSNYTAEYVENSNLDNVYTIGGEVAVSQGVKEKVGSDSRIAGQHRWETATQIAQEFFSSPLNATVATGRDFPDALSGGVYAATQDAPVLLTESDQLPSGVENYFSQEETLDEVSVFGGRSVVSDEVVQTIE